MGFPFQRLISLPLTAYFVRLIPNIDSKEWIVIHFGCVATKVLMAVSLQSCWIWRAEKHDSWNRYRSRLNFFTPKWSKVVPLSNFEYICWINKASEFNLSVILRALCLSVLLVNNFLGLGKSGKRHEIRQEAREPVTLSRKKVVKFRVTYKLEWEDVILCPEKVYWIQWLL